MLARISLIVVFLLGLTPALAEVARVTSGEHSDFTRIVVEAEGQGDWRFGRSPDGYELELGPDVGGFDLTDAFGRIPRSRVTSLWRDTDTGRLRFSLACACHAIAFEFRPGIVVIDIRSGPPPAGSAFETRLEAETPADTPAAPPVLTAQPVSPAVNGYDWIELARETSTRAAGRDLPLPTGDVSLAPLRDALLAQISRGVAEGVIDVAEKLPPARSPAGTVDGALWGRISIGEMPGLRVGSANDSSEALSAGGDSCISDAALDVANWGLAGPVPAQIGLGRSGLLTEFDTPVPEAILRAAKLHIYMGFGAEARQYLQLLDGRRAGHVALLDALARIVDEEPVAASPFEGQESCNTAAALWATLARRGQPMAPMTNKEAVARSFSALPLHLRRYLGPPLVDAFLGVGDDSTARLLRDAILRSPADGLHGVELMDARYQLAEGKDHAAGEIAAGVLADGGQAGPEAVVTLVEAAFRGTRQIDPKVPASVEAFLHDNKGMAIEARLARANVLATAMTGDFAKAFAVLGQSPETFADLWLLAAGDSSDEVFLEQAGRWSVDRPELAAATARRVAERLLSLGFPDLALQWLGPINAASAEDLRILAATARLALRDAPATIALLDGINSSDAARLRAAATLQLGDAEAAARLMISAGETEEGKRTLTWTQDWTLILSEGPDDWRAPAGLLTPPDLPPAAGPIAHGTQLADESEAAREMIGDLLLAVPSPTSP